MAFELIDTRTRFPFFSVPDGGSVDTTLLDRLYRDTRRLDETSAAFFRRKTILADTPKGLQIDGTFEFLTLVSVRNNRSGDKNPLRSWDPVYSHLANPRLYRTTHIVSPDYGLLIPQLELIVRNLGPKSAA